LGHAIGCALVIEEQRYFDLVGGTMGNAPVTVSQYLIRRLQEIGVAHVFGVPGDYVLDFLDEVIAGPLHWVGNCNELNAGYAADGYARMKGVSAAVVTYGVGGLSILNAVAGAYAEHVAVVVLSGAPPTTRRRSGALMHHLVADYRLQYDIFRKVTADAAILDDPATAPEQIDRVLGRCVAERLPVYLELPADMARRACELPAKPCVTPVPQSDPESLRECVEEAAALLGKASHPIVLVGGEVSRLRLGSETLALVEQLELPFATMLSGKSVLPELHPQFIGLYQGNWSRPIVSKQVETSDCLLSFGAWMTDLDTGMFSTRLDPRSLIAAKGGHVQIRSHYYHNIQLGGFVRALAAAATPRSYVASHPAEPYRPPEPFRPVDKQPLTAARFYERIDEFLDDQMVLLAEPGDSFCAASEFHVEEAENFIVQPFYASIGFCTPAALGVSLACPKKRAVVLTGDGAFQMTAQEVSTLLRHNCPAIILVVNNDGYLVERVLHEDGSYNDIQPWSYAKLPEVFGKNAVCMKVTTEGELERALTAAQKETTRLTLIEAQIGRLDASAGLTRLGAAFRAAQKK
jgi:TPP-dependent 2-oxoacid decarboxylase